MYRKFHGLLTLSLSASVLLISSSVTKASAMNLVNNGSFEVGGPRNLLVGIGSDAIADWEVTQDNVHQHTGFWNSLGSDPDDISNTYNAIDLDGGVGSVGAIAQTINTVVGETYHLTFHMGGNYFGFSDLDRQMEVFWGGRSLGVFTHDLSPGESRSNFEWDSYKIDVTGTGSDELKFVSLSGANAGWGAAVDLVSVKAKSTPEPSTLLGLSIFVLAGGTILGRKQRH